MTAARCPVCGAEMVPMRLGSSLTIWFCLGCPEIHVEMPDLWRAAAEGRRR